MTPGTFDDAVVAGQRIGVGADVGSALHVVVAAEDVGAAARHADVAHGQLHDAGGAHNRGAGGVLGLAHAPHHGRRAVLGLHLGGLEDSGFRHAAGLFYLVGRPPRHHVGLDLVHAIDAVVDVLLV